MTKHTSNSIIWDDKWQMIQVKQHEHSKLWVFFAMVNKQWYYGEGNTIADAIAGCEQRIDLSIKMKMKPNLEELF